MRHHHSLTDQSSPTGDAATALYRRDGAAHGRGIVGRAAFSAPILSEFEQRVVKLISESYKFLGMADDLNNVASYLSEIRICFIMLTVTTYFLLAIFFIRFCVARSQRRVNGGTGAGGGSNGAILTTTSTGTGPSSATAGRRHFSHNNRTSHWDYQTNTDEYQNAIGAAAGQTNIGTTDDLMSVRSDGQVGSGPAAAASAAKSYMGRNHRSQAPSFMRHSHHMNHAAAAGGGPQPGGGGTIGVYSATTRLIGAEHLQQQQENSTANLRHSASPGAGQPSTPTSVHQSHQQQQQQPHHHHHTVPIPHIVTSGETGISGGTRMDNNGNSPMGNAVSPASSTTDPNVATSTLQGTNQMATLRHHGRAGGAGGGSLLDRQEITATDM